MSVLGQTTYGDIPLNLKRHMKPQIQELLITKWFQTAKDYFANPPQIHILSVDTKSVELLNILGELKKYIKNGYGKVQYSTGVTNSELVNDKAIQKISSILEKINPEKLSKIQRRALRKYIEITPIGRDILKAFFADIVEKGMIAPDMELIFNPFTSLVNLAEIYAQCNEYSCVRFATPELGIKNAEIHLYYPSAKRDAYLHADSGWLTDALRRICFFNWLLGNNKQPRAIHVFLAEFRKEFMHVTGKDDMVFTPSEINTGVCDMTDIIITRSEESLKTLFHELIHFHSLDFKHTAHDEFCAGLFNITTEQSSFNLFEAHTECLASILHCITRSVTVTDKSEGPTNFDSRFIKLFTVQVYYTIKKAAHILAKSGCNSYSEFTTPTDRGKCQLTENTNVFSYFFVKSFLYMGLREWITVCCDKRTARFLDTHSGQEKLKLIIHTGYQNKIIQKIIDAELELCQTQPVTSNNNSLKMVCIS